MQRILKWITQLKTPQEQFDLLKWLTKLRWVVAVLQMCSLFPAMALGFVGESNILAYILVMSTVPLFNLLLISLDANENSKFAPETLIFSGLIFDMQQLVVLLAMTGGWNNPFSSMVFIYATLAAMSVGSRKSVIFGILLVLNIVLLQKVFRSEIITRVPWSQPFTDMIVESIVGISLMIIVSSLIAKLFDQEKQVSSLRRSRLRMDRLRAVGALSSGVCHQLATPLNNIGMRLERLLRDEAADNIELFESIASMKRSLNKADKALRKLADIQVNPETTIIEKSDVSQLLDDTINSWLRDPDRGSYQVKTSKFPNLELNLPVSAFVQVILDMLDNAAEAMEGGRGCIKVELENDQEFVIVSVEDEGPGFSEAALEYLGEPFNSQKDGGSGLGIYHAQLISQLLGGSISVVNTNNGAKVSIKMARES